MQKDGKDGSSPSEGKDKEGAKLWEGALEELGKQIKKRPRALKQLKDGLAQVQRKGWVVQRETGVQW